MKLHHAPLALAALWLAACPSTPDQNGDAGVPPPISDGASDSSASVDGSSPDGGNLPTNDGGRAGTPIVPPPLATPDSVSNLPLPQTDGGLVVLSSSPEIQLVIDPSAPRTPVSALLQCARIVANCVATRRTLDDCTASAPRCATDTPWTEATLCCPSSCMDAYAGARTGGQDSLPAWKATFFTRGVCFPGIAARN